VLCVEVMGMIESKVGQSVFYKTRSAVERQVSHKREERRKDRKLQAIIDPEARAKRKLVKNEMKTNARKRKSEDFMKKKVRYSVKKARSNENE
jgi:hypothetical protein